MYCIIAIKRRDNCTYAILVAEFFRRLYLFDIILFDFPP